MPRDRPGPGARPSLAQMMLAQAPVDTKPAPAPQGASLVDVMLNTAPPAPSESVPKRRPKPAPTPAQILDSAKRPAAAPLAAPGPILVELVNEAQPQPRPPVALAPHRLAAVAGAAAPPQPARTPPAAPSLAATSRAQAATAQSQAARAAPPSGAKLVELLPEAPGQPARGPNAAAALILDAEAPRAPKPRGRAGGWKLLALAGLLAIGLVASAWMLGGALPVR